MTEARATPVVAAMPLRGSYNTSKLDRDDVQPHI